MLTLQFHVNIFLRYWLFFPFVYLWWAEVFKGPPNRHNLDTGSIIINLYFENIGSYKVGKNRNYPRVGQVITYLDSEHCQ